MSKFANTVRQIGAHQKAAGLFADPFKNYDPFKNNDPFKGSRHIFDNAKFANPFGQAPKPHGVGAAKPAAHPRARKPVKRVTVHPRPLPRLAVPHGAPPHGRPVHGKPGMVGGGSHATPPRPGASHSADPVEFHVWGELVKAIVSGLIVLGDAVVLVISGVGEMIFQVTQALVEACRRVGRNAPPLGGNGAQLSAWMAEHWIISSTGIPLVLGIISGAAFR